MLPDPFNKVPVSALSSITRPFRSALFRRSDPVTAMFFLQSGAVDLVRYTMQGDEIVLHRAHPGESFAEPALFSPEYHCDAIAAAGSVVVRIDKSAILALMRTDPDFALAISARFAGQIQNYRRRLEILAIRDARSRVFAAVADGMLSGDIKSFAAQIGLTHEATYRALSVLARAGRLTKTGRGAYTMPDVRD